MATHSKVTTRRIKRVQEMRNQLENLRKDLIADSINNTKVEQQIDTVSEYLKILEHSLGGV